MALRSSRGRERKVGGAEGVAEGASMVRVSIAVRSESSHCTAMLRGW